MGSLIKRQIRKYLPEHLAKDKDLAVFLDAVTKSYSYYDEQYAMQQRAMALSSEELFAANGKLRKEAASQKKVIDKLKRVIKTLEFYKLSETNKTDSNIDLDGLGLIEVIDSQTKDIIKINKQREKLLSELAYQNQELSDYAHMVSHDLKSPLRSIDTLTVWLKEDYKGKFDDKGENSLELIRNNVEKMDKLINGILEYSSISKNRKATYTIDLNLLIEDILNTLTIPKHITIKKAKNLPLINGDKCRLQQLFTNLIENAIRYNDKDKGVIEIDFKSKTKFWQFTIKDNGKGIDPQYHEKIFKTFEKLENNTDSSGIGLSIVKKIVTLYKGKIWLESSLNKGSTFYFTLKK